MGKSDGHIPSTRRGGAAVRSEGPRRGAPNARGDVLVDKYRVKAVLGSGGMGVVYAAHQLSIDRPVAIKILHVELAGEPSTVRRFQREARAAAALSSEHAVRIVDVDKLPNGVP